METSPVSLGAWLLALSPIVVVLVLMVGFRWGGAKAGPAGWFTALLVSIVAFGAGPELIAYSQLKGVLLSAYVLYIIWMALVMYNVVAEAGAVSAIGAGFVRLTRDPVLQILILAWVFSSFLQGVGGFGVPVAVVAPLLIGLGFSPATAVVATLVGHSWSVSFGSMGSSFQVLTATTGLPGALLAPSSAMLMGVICLVCGLATAHIHGGFEGVRRGALPTLVVGLCMSLAQYLAAVTGLWNLGAFIAALVGLGAVAILTRLPAYRGTAAQTDSSGHKMPMTKGQMSVGWAVIPYLLLIVIVILAELWAPLHTVLNRVQIRVPFPETRTALGWTQPAEMGRTISIFGHPGALLAYAALISYFLYQRRGYYRPGTVKNILSQTLYSAIPSSLGIVTMVGFAVLMTHSGMTYTLAKGISLAMGKTFPFFSPFIGALGAFMTGSNTNSNVVFATLQMSTAELIGRNVVIILAAQTAGGALGGMVAPAKVIVGCSTAGLAGQEGQVLRQTLLYGLAILIGVGLLILILA